MRTSLALTAFLLGGCGPDITGAWDGPFTIEIVNGGVVQNDLIVSELEASMTLYVTEADPNEPTQDLVYEIPFLGTWTDDGGGAFSFVWDCDLDGCTLDPTFDCTYDDDVLSCLSTPDIYGDDAANLVWTRVE